MISQTIKIVLLVQVQVGTLQTYTNDYQTHFEPGHKHMFINFHIPTHISNFLTSLSSHSYTHIAIMYREMLIKDIHPSGTYVRSRCTSVVSPCLIVSWAQLCSAHLLIGCEPPCCADCCCKSTLLKWEQLYQWEWTRPTVGMWSVMVMCQVLRRTRKGE